jgi:Right handed beta helix region
MAQRGGRASGGGERTLGGRHTSTLRLTLAPRFRARLVRGFGVLAFWVIASLVGASTAGAQCPASACGEPADCTVDDALGNDASGCCATACKTIQFAIGEASVGNVIKVAAGTYPENPGASLNVNKMVTLCGAQAGVDARTRAAAESRITNPRGTIVSASNVILDGFTFEGVTNSSFTYGVDMALGTEGTQVYNSILQNNIAAIGLANTGPSQVLICQNLFLNNNQPGGGTGSGIYTDQFVCGNNGGARPCTNFLITENAFEGNDNTGVNLSNEDTTAITNVDIGSNTFDMNGRAVLLFNVDHSTIHNNRITNSTLAGSGDIRIFGPVDDLTITSNDMSGGANWAFRITNGPSSGIAIHLNNIANYAGDNLVPSSPNPGGLFVSEGAYPGVLDATCNWWNDPCGPFNVANNPTGPGEEVREEVPSNVNFISWLIAPGPAPMSGTGTCSGTAITCRLTTTTTTTPSSTVPTTTSTPVTTTTTSTPVTTTTTVVVPTSTTLPPKICDPLTVTQASFRPSKSTLFIRATFPDGTFAGLDPRQQYVHLQVRGASGELVSCTIPAAQWQKLFQHTFGFFDQQMTVCPPIKCLSLTLPKKGQTRATITMAGMTPSPLLSPLEITFNVDDQCAAGPLSMQQKATRRRVFP